MLTADGKPSHGGPGAKGRLGYEVPEGQGW